MKLILSLIRPRIIGVVTVILVTILNFELLTKIFQVRRDKAAFYKSDDTPRVGRFDQTRQFIIFDSLFVGDNFWQLSEQKSVCLATVSTLDKLNWLPQVITHWGGLVSLAIYLKDSEEQLLQFFLNYLYICYNNVMTNVTVHLIRPASNAAIYKKVSSYLISASTLTQCLNPPTVLKVHMNYSVVTNNPQNPGVPQNHMRNVARKGCGTKYVITSDIDVIPSKEAESQLEKFLKKKENRDCYKCAFAIPTYELDDHVSFPKSKSELLAFESKGHARPFHEEVFIQNQFATNFSRWRSFNTTTDIVISHPVGDFEFFYEPFYVSLDTVPPHDERFLGYGYTRTTQVYEMLLSGWKFYVLSPIFLIHWGIQRRNTRPKWRENENKHNSLLFINFQREIRARYKMP